MLVHHKTIAKSILCTLKSGACEGTFSAYSHGQSTACPCVTKAMGMSTWLSHQSHWIMVHVASTDEKETHGSKPNIKKMAISENQNENNNNIKCPELTAVSIQYLGS